MVKWQETAAQMQKHRADTITAVKPAVPDPPQDLPRNVTNIPRQLLSEEVVSITETRPENLIQALASGKLSSTLVVTAFLQRAGLASRLVNCCTELLPDRALARAKHLDDYLNNHGKPIGPLHGLPISVKEHVGMKGLDLNAGFVSWVGQLGTDDAIILKFLWNAGCIFYARTTQPQTLMHLETSNNIYGVTVNPYNSRLTSGGSSGGEGALLGLHGSCIGIGTDIGGSIRSPAANNGLFGLRPTSYRLSTAGWDATMGGEEQIIGVIGPLSTSLEGIKLFMHSILSQQPWRIDPSLVPLPWKTESQLRQNPQTRQKTLRVGVFADDGIVRPHPPILRGLNTLVSKLRDNPDIDVVDFPPYKPADAWPIVARLYFVDGGAEETTAVNASGEPWRPLSRWILPDNPYVRERTVPEVWKLTARREAYRAAWTRHWNSVGTGLPGPEDEGASVLADVFDPRLVDDMVDVILCPVGPGCAPKIDCARYWNYTALWNLLDYPALVFPTGLVCGPEDQVEKDYVPRNEQDEYNYKLYDPETYVNAPISLQLVGRRYEDEKVVQALEMIRDATGWDFQPPRTTS